MCFNLDPLKNKMKKNIYTIFTILTSLTFSACFFPTEVDDGISADTQGYKPVYVTQAEANNVEIQEAKDIEDFGKIYVFGDYLFVNDRFKGVHVINNQNPLNPQKLAFINIPGNVDIAVKNNTLYADNLTDLLVFDIQDPQNISLTKRVSDAFPSLDFPPVRGTYFECVEPSKGKVIAWEFSENLENAQCWR